MIIRIIFFVALVLGSSISSFAQDNITRDADGNLWLITDTIQGSTYYIDNKGKKTEVIANESLSNKQEELDSIIMHNQFDLWSKVYGHKDFEPYASAIYSIFFSKKMKIVEIRILKRGAYERNPVIDNILIKSIKNTKSIWKCYKKNKSKKNIIYVSRTRVVIPDVLTIL
jgi:hypothetical protein